VPVIDLIKIRYISNNCEVKIKSRGGGTSARTTTKGGLEEKHPMVVLLVLMTTFEITISV
jgi:hypothetical protein